MKSHSYIIIIFNNLYQNCKKEPLIVSEYTLPGIPVYKRFFYFSVDFISAQVFDTNYQLLAFR